MLHVFMINKNDKYLSKLWESYFYNLLSNIITLGFIYILMNFPLLFTSESSKSDNHSIKEEQSKCNNLNPKHNPNDSDIISKNE